MILIITSSEDVTADLVIKELSALKARYIRFNTETYPTSSEIVIEYSADGIRGIIRTDSGMAFFEDIDTVWYRKPMSPVVSSEIVDEQARQFARQESEACLSGLYRVLNDAYWVSKPKAIRHANDKILQLAVAKKIGFDVPDTIVTSDPQRARMFYEAKLNDVIIKPLKSGIIEYADGTINLIYTSVLTLDDLKHFDKVSFAPCLLQQYIPKKYEIRATVIGRQVMAVGLDTQQNELSRHDWRKANCSGVKYFGTTLPKSVEMLCYKFMDYYELEFSAFDFIVTPDDKCYFIENNPNGQWAWLDLELNNGMISKMAQFLYNGGKNAV